ncbi:MAG: HAD family phosphatase [Flavobacteriales bacterium]|nr:HAD family phosphatase [Flavobacteriales bacterium]
MLDLSGIKNIIFDLGGVILNIDYQLTSTAFSKLGFAEFDDFYTQQRQDSIFDELETGKLGKSEFINLIQNHIPRASEQEIILAWNAMLLDLPNERVSLLADLSVNFNQVLLSNTNEIHEVAFLKIIENSGADSNKLYPCFDSVYLSHKIGLRKPDAKCFKYVLEQEGWNAEETLFIDDSIQHIEGARREGIKSHHLKKSETILSLFPDKVQ